MIIGMLVFLGIVILAALVCQGLYLIEKHMIKRERD